MLYLKKPCFSAAGNVAKQLCSACCKGLVLIANILCSLFNLSAINKKKKTTVDNTGSVACLLMWEVITHMTSVHSSKNKEKQGKAVRALQKQLAICTEGC